MRNISANAKVSEEGEREGAGCTPRTGAEISLQPVVKPTVSQAVPLQPVEGHGAGCVRFHTRAGRCA